VVKSDKTAAHCLRQDNCCATLVDANRNCYRAQCFATARELARRLDLPDGGYTVCFQSRLGRTPWIAPYTDHVLDELARSGKRRLAVMCPAFVADCLETLEEIGMRAREQFRAAGGEELVLIPSLNATQPWIDAVVALARRHLTPAAAETAEIARPAAG
jgi:ferrochelatase